MALGGASEAEVSNRAPLDLVVVLHPLCQLDGGWEVPFPNGGMSSASVFRDQG